MTVNVANGTFRQVTVPASGDTTGATDLANLNAALVTGAMVYGVAGQTYYLNGALYLYSGGGLDMTGATINQVAGTLLNMIRNKAVDATTTATDGATTSGSAVLTSTTLAAVAQVGDAIQVVNAGYGTNQSSWYGTVLSVNAGAHQITLSCNAQSTIAAAATCYRYATRDSDITLIGGHWNPVDLSAGTTVLTQFVTCFRRVDRIKVKDMIFTQPGTRGVGGRFNLSFGDVTELRVDNIHFTSTAGDGVHVYGPAARVSITDISGNTGDDIFGINSADSFSGNPQIDTQGNVNDVTVERIYPNAAASAGAIYSCDTSALFTMSNITVRTIKATAATTAHALLVYTGPSGTPSCPMNNILIEDVAVPPPNGSAYGVVTINNPGAESVTVRDITWTASFAAADGIVLVNNCGGNLLVENVRMASSPSSTSYGVVVASSGVSTATIRGIKVDGSPSTFVGAFCNGGTIGSLSLSDVRMGTSGWTVLQVNSTTTFTNGIHLEDILAQVTTGISLPTSNPATTIRAQNVQFSGTNFVSTGGPVTVRAANCDFNTSGGIIALTNTAATGSRVTLRNCAQAGAGATLTRSASQSMSLNAPDGPGQDLATLTPTEGDLVIDSSSRTGAAGVAIYHSGGTGNGWKNLYTAGTY